MSHFFIKQIDLGSILKANGSLISVELENGIDVSARFIGKEKKGELWSVELIIAEVAAQARPMPDFSITAGDILLLHIYNEACWKEKGCCGLAEIKHSE